MPLPFSMKGRSPLSGEVVLRRTARFWVGLATVLALLAHVMACAERILPANAIIALIGVLSLGWAVFACYLNLFLQRSLGISLLGSLAALSAKPSEERFHADQLRLHRALRAWWAAIPLGLRWQVLPATCYLAWLTVEAFLGADPLRLFGDGFQGLRMYSAVWLATSLPMLAFLGFVAGRKVPVEP